MTKASVLKTAATRRLSMRKVDTMYIFDPRVHMNLNKEDLNTLDCFEKFDNLEWFIETQKLSSGATFGE